LKKKENREENGFRPFLFQINKKENVGYAEFMGNVNCRMVIDAARGCWICVHAAANGAQVRAIISRSAQKSTEMCVSHRKVSPQKRVAKAQRQNRRGRVGRHMWRWWMPEADYHDRKRRWRQLPAAQG
jgi:hypothetical protein